MNHESTDFAAYRFSQRTARDVSYYYPGRHFKPEHESHVMQAVRWIVCLAAAAAVGAMCAGWRPL